MGQPIDSICYCAKTKGLMIKNTLQLNEFQVLEQWLFHYLLQIKFFCLKNNKPNSKQIGNTLSARPQEGKSSKGSTT